MIVPLLNQSRLFGMFQAWKLQPAVIGRLLAYTARQAICQSLGARRWPCRSRDRAGEGSDWHAIPVEFMIFIVTALPSAKVGKVAHELEAQFVRNGAGAALRAAR